MSTFTVLFTGTTTLDGTPNVQGAVNVIISEGFTSIFNYTFSGNASASNMETITLPASLISIADVAFEGAPKLREIIFAGSSTLRSIGNGAFRYCSLLSSVIIPDSVTELGPTAFSECNSLTSVTYGPNPSLKTIGGQCFQHTILTSVIIPNGVTSIGPLAFYTNPREVRFTPPAPIDIHIPASVTRIDDGAFFRRVSRFTVSPQSTSFVADNEAVLYTYNRNSLHTVASEFSTSSFEVPSSVLQINSYAFSGSLIPLITFASPSQINFISGAVFSYSSITTITIPSSVTAIGSYCFSETKSLRTVIFAPTSTLTSIPSGMFSGSNLTLCVIPASVTLIEDNAFKGTKISAINFEANSRLARIGSRAFSSCTQLTSVNIPSTLTEIATSGETSDIFAVGNSQNTFITNLNIYSGLSGVLRPIISGLLALKTVTMDYSGEIPAGVFNNIIGITDVTIGRNITRIGNSVFGFSGINKITINGPSSLASIGESAFQNCDLLTSLVLPDTITSIESRAFYNCRFLTSINIPATINIINTEVFGACHRLTSINIPSTVTRIGNSAFDSCGITTFNFGLNPLLNYIGFRAFASMSITSIYIPLGVTRIESTAFTSSVSLQKVEFDDISTVNTLSLPPGNLVSGYNVSTGFFGAVRPSIVFQYLASLIIAKTPICFPKGTPITTNQGDVAIEELNPDIHTIRGKNIVAITQTRPLHQYIVSIEKDALGKNVPCATTQISKEHKVFYNGEMVKAKDLIDMCEGVTKIPYNGEPLYNVLLKKHDKMMVNNLICETLDPNNIMAKICSGKYNSHEQAKICKELNDIIDTDNVPAYKKLYASLK